MLLKTQILNKYLDEAFAGLDDIFDGVDKEPVTQTPTNKTEISSRRIDSYNKNKEFKEDLNNDNNQLMRAISHISFTNQTDMFDNYDSQNSFRNDDLNTN